MSLSQPLNESRYRTYQNTDGGQSAVDVNDSSDRHFGRSAASAWLSRPVATKWLLLLAAVSLVAIVGLAGVALHERRAAGDGVHTAPPASLEQAITTAGLYQHMRALQSVADANDNKRVAGSSGYNASVAYVMDTLASSSRLRVQVQHVPVVQWHLLSPAPTLTFHMDGADTKLLLDTDFVPVFGSASVSLDNVTVSAPANAGCLASEWEPVAAGSFAFVPLSPTSFACVDALLRNAAAAQVAVLALAVDATWNDGHAVSVGLPEGLPYSSLLVSYIPGTSLWTAAQAATRAGRSSAVRVTFHMSASVRATTAANVIADTSTGNASSTIVIGAHLDSVSVGPGLDDNGSGSSAVLEMAMRFAALLDSGVIAQPPNRVRFCWWAGEEELLLGSVYHVALANASTVVGERLADYAAYINLDTIAMPNFKYGIYAPNPALIAPQSQAGSQYMTRWLEAYFQAQGWPYDLEADLPAEATDSATFLQLGVPSGGVLSGTLMTKTVAERDALSKALGIGAGGLAHSLFDRYATHCSHTHSLLYSSSLCCRLTSLLLLSVL